MGMELTEMEVAGFREHLLQWYSQAQRRLPWRQEVSLYRTVVSELMCQQTQIATVLPYFARWMARFPDFAALAVADEATVLKHWEGLGYYRRARMLHRLAQELTARNEPPQTAKDWQELPGIGPYTAAAIASIHHGEAMPVIDGNVIRVLSRLSADGTAFTSSAQALSHLGPLARRLVDPRRPGDYNQALMELGALVCTKTRPQCLLCPVRAFCVAGRRGDAEDYPRLVRAATRAVVVERLWVEADGRLLLHRKAAGAQRLAALAELPAHADLPEASLGELRAVKRRGISNERLEERIHRAVLPKQWEGSAAFLWASRAELAALTLSGPHRRWIEELWSTADHPRGSQG